MDKYLWIIVLVNGLMWVRSSWGKLASGTFVNTLGATLSGLSAKNPYGFYKSMIENFAVPNSVLVGNLVMYGEALVAICLVLGSILALSGALNKPMVPLFILGLVGAALLNIMFYLLAGYTNPSTDSVNLLMLGIEVVAIFRLLNY